MALPGQWASALAGWGVAKSLLDDHRWSAGYYVAGYAVECGLKACVLARLAGTPEVIFDDRRFSEKCWTHSARELIRLAGLESILSADIAANRVLDRNWHIVMDWSEQSRYETTSHHKAKKLYNAIADNTNGVMQWIRAHW
jgi:hypothetical protein